MKPIFRKCNRLGRSRHRRDLRFAPDGGHLFACVASPQCANNRLAASQAKRFAVSSIHRSAALDWRAAPRNLSTLHFISSLVAKS
jgi:hypothetical protein